MIRPSPLSSPTTPLPSDLIDQLPLTLRFRDFNHVEKIAKLPRPLTMEGVPAGDDPEINDIGYYAPSGDLVLYYGDVGYSERDRTDRSTQRPGHEPSGNQTGSN